MRLNARSPSWNGPVAAALGAVLGFFYVGGPRTGAPDPRIVFLLICLLCAAGIVCVRMSPAGGRRFGVFCLLFSCSCLLFSFRRLEYGRSLSENTPGQPLDHIAGYTGYCLDDSARTSGGKTLVRLQLMETRGFLRCGTGASGVVVVLVEGGRSSFSWGEICSMESPLRTVPDSPGVLFSFPEEASVTRKGWTGILFRIRSEARRGLSAATDRLDPGSLLSALFLGDKDRLSPGVYEAFMKSGSVHILALSGMHLGLIAMLLSFLLGPFLGKRRAFRLILVMLAVYLFIAGPKPSLLRAALMTVTARGFAELRRSTDPVVIPAIAFLVYLYADPGASFSLAFQLSFLAITGIIVLEPALTARLLPFFPRPLAAGLSASVAAQVFTAPVIVGAFGVFYPVGIFAALILGPLTTVFLWIGIAGISLSALVPGVGQVFAFILHFLSEGIIMVVTVCSKFPALHV